MMRLHFETRFLSIQVLLFSAGTGRMGWKPMSLLRTRVRTLSAGYTSSAP